MISLSTTIICRVAFGIRFDEEAHEKRKFDELLEESATMLTSFYDSFLYLDWIDKFIGLTNRLVKNFKKYDEFYEELIEKHLDPNSPKSIEGDILDLLLQLKKDKLTPIDLTFEDIKATVMNVLLAESYTSAAALLWTVTAFMKNPKAMKTVQEEIRKSVKKGGILNEYEIQNLPYFYSSISDGSYRTQRDQCSVSGSLSTLGLVVSKDSIIVDPENIEAIRDCSKPTLITVVQSFIELWYEECEMSYRKLKEFLTTTPILTLPFQNEGSTIYCDAFGIFLGCIFKQQGWVIVNTITQLKLTE
ncbi:cytochrome P450 83B1-like [Solanum tuberosum]|uniref:cytochrome P450 83B1-like n=1 Tax=Solanum tuberosum TaxID=4113 RepID=UPI00073A4368|nr:PREDICTED: cytochrome P450 83B1-like [Solanum tuberosum]